MNTNYIVPVVASDGVTQDRVRAYLDNMNIFTGREAQYHAHRMYEEHTRLGDFIVVETPEKGLAQAVHEHLTKGGLTVLPVKNVDASDTSSLPTTQRHP